VARTSEIGKLPAASSPTRASEPRTEITRPKDVTAINPITSRMMSPDIIRTPTGQTVKPEQVPTLQIRLLVPSFTDAGGVLTVLRQICV
jgi:hypothetical protein